MLAAFLAVGFNKDHKFLMATLIHASIIFPSMQKVGVQIIKNIQFLVVAALIKSCGIYRVKSGLGILSNDPKGYDALNKPIKRSSYLQKRLMCVPP
jgi:hypothetical protein